MELLILADDLTGALDTGIQFVAAGASTRVVLDPHYDLGQVDPDVQVLVVDTESRHIAQEDAADLIRHIVRQAVELSVSCIYKKTDSALRGNVGAELGAALEASGADQLHFIPVYPKTKRTTKNGIHYIDGIPVGKSVFRNDPFNPVLSSRVADVLSEGSGLPMISVKKEESAGDFPGIQIYDAETDADILKRSRELQAKGKLFLLAGCAGFASVLSELMDLRSKPAETLELPGAFLMACGSVNPITREQVKEAVESGRFRYFPIPPEESLTPHWFTAEEKGQAQVQEWADYLARGEKCILDTNDIPGRITAYAYAQQQGWNLEDVRHQIPVAMGEALRVLLDKGVEATLMVTGGDVLMGFMREMEICEIEPVQELFTGTVLSYVRINGKKQPLISKSGGFGSPDLLLQLLEKLS